ncbi:baseplate J/gp47 family protein [Francisella philomiragia]|uniref:baseplate assembly protein n=1 Tax=Francisella philomiragia TaxID=28110 RepID=UPI001C9D99E5|nr:baseplate J/gp47 family protein [Francisella philomiragia]MBY7733479.1 baseplate J/gp47 family protein [Francisella philomiragia]
MSVNFDLNKLPYPDAITKVSYEDNLAALLAKYQELEPNWTAYLKSDPVAKIFEAAAYVISVKDQERNDQIKAVLVSSAERDDLDNLGAFYALPREVDESDERYRTRILLAPDKMSSAGAAGYYEALSYDSDTRVIDIKAHDDILQPGKAFVVLKSNENDDGVASQDLIDTVSAYLNDEDRKPLGCQVFVSSVIPVMYTVEANVELNDNVDSVLIIQTMNKNIQELVESKKVIGGSIALSEIYASLNIEGVAIVQDLVSPTANIATDVTELPFCTDIIINEV